MYWRSGVVETPELDPARTESDAVPLHAALDRRQVGVVQRPPPVRIAFLVAKHPEQEFDLAKDQEANQDGGGILGRQRRARLADSAAESARRPRSSTGSGAMRKRRSVVRANAAARLRRRSGREGARRSVERPHRVRSASPASPRPHPPRSVSTAPRTTPAARQSDPGEAIPGRARPPCSGRARGHATSTSVEAASAGMGCPSFRYATDCGRAAPLDLERAGRTRRPARARSVG